MRFTEGIVLKKTDAGEADALFVLYTKDFGKMTVLAKGVKKEGAKLKGRLGVFNFIAADLVFGKSGVRVTGASVINFWPEIRRDWAKIKSAWAVKELVLENCFEGEKDERLWELICGSFAFLENSRTPFEETARFLRLFKRDLSLCLGYGGKVGGSSRGGTNPFLIV